MKCRFCREEIPEGVQECPNCGTPVEEEKTSHDSQEAAEDNTGLPRLREDPPHDSQESGEQSGQQEQGPQNPYRYGGQEQQNPYQHGQQNPYQYGGYGAGPQNGYQYGAPGQGDYRQPGGPVSGTPYMIFAILTTLLCCLPLGIAAIVYASRINAYQRMGDYAGARDAANKARLFSILGAVGGVVITIFYIVAFVVGMRGNAGNYDLFPTEKMMEEYIRGDAAGEPENDTGDDDQPDEGNYDTGDDGDESPMEPAEQEEELGDEWDDYTVQINDKLVTLPCTIEDLEAAGLTMAEDELPEDFVVAANEYVSVYFEDKKGNYIAVSLVNMTDSKQPAEKCLVGGITVMDYSVSKGGLEVVLPGEIKIGTRKDTVLNRYGDTDDFYEGDNVHTYTWYEEDAAHEKCEIEMDAESRLVTSMSIQNYGF